MTHLERALGIPSAVDAYAAPTWLERWRRCGRQYDAVIFTFFSAFPLYS
jgi:hypothetical protein